MGAGLVAIYHIQNDLTRAEISQKERLNLTSKVSVFANRFDTIRADLMVLAKQSEFREIFDPNNTPEVVQQFQSMLAEEYFVMSQEHQRYDQIRFLDINGQEVVRVNFNRGQPGIVPNEKLQNKSDRYWFKETLALPKGEVFVSPLDLNVENGKLDQPFKPMLRFGAVVFDDRGRKRGAIVLNYLAELFLNELARENSTSIGQTLLLNADGYWLKAEKPEDEWGFMFDDRGDRTFQKKFPAAWQQISNQKTGQFQTAEGLFTFTTVYPLLEVQKTASATTSAKTLTTLESSHGQVNAQSYAWKMVTHVPASVLTERSQTTCKQFFFLFVGLTGLNAVGSFFLAQARVKHQQSEGKAMDLTQALRELQLAQTQLVHSEKMASLGQLVAGIAHEINNPVNFIHGNLNYANDYTQNLLRLIQLYQQHYPNPDPEVRAEAETIDIEFLQKDLPKLMASMKMGTTRIREIVLSLRNFSRMDESEFKTVDIHDGIDSTLMILQHRLKADTERPEIQVIKNYGDLPLVECYPGLLNQVFMNILANAIDALDEASTTQTSGEAENNPSAITICTAVIDSQWVKIAIADNGIGMPDRVKQQIFDPFFTTKPVGKGTGMGMSISYQIVTKKHGGKLECFSTPGIRTEFVIRVPVKQQFSVLG
jgi:signal transduction histidine kinase